jgi:hypothetical protein
MPACECTATWFVTCADAKEEAEEVCAPAGKAIQRNQMAHSAYLCFACLLVPEIVLHLVASSLNTTTNDLASLVLQPHLFQPLTEDAMRNVGPLSKDLDWASQPDGQSRRLHRQEACHSPKTTVMTLG